MLRASRNPSVVMIAVALPSRPARRTQAGHWPRFSMNAQESVRTGDPLPPCGIDNTAKNGNVPDPRNLATFGNSSLSNMFIVFNLAEFLTDEQYVAEVTKRKEFLKLTGEENIGCPACYLPTPDPAPKKPAGTNQTSSVPAPAPATGGTN